MYARRRPLAGLRRRSGRCSRSRLGDRVTLPELVLGLCGPSLGFDRRARARRASSPGRSACRSVSATLAWALAALFARARRCVFLVRASLTLTLVLARCVVARRRSPFALQGRRGGRAADARAAVRSLGGRHRSRDRALARRRRHRRGRLLPPRPRAKLLDVRRPLARARSNEFADGGLHPGYAFPLWHGVPRARRQARRASIPPQVVLHEASVLAPLAFLVACEAGWALFRRAWAGLAVLRRQVALFALARRERRRVHVARAPRDRARRQLLVPAVLALALRPRRRAVARRDRGRSPWRRSCSRVVHPTYALFLWIPLAGFLAARLLLARADARAGAPALAALVVPAAAVLALAAAGRAARPPRSPRTKASSSGRSRTTRASSTCFAGRRAPGSRPELFGRSGAVAVAALLCSRSPARAPRRWAAFVARRLARGAAADCSSPSLFTHFSDVVSLSQSRRAAGFVPFPFAFAGGSRARAAPRRWSRCPSRSSRGSCSSSAIPATSATRSRAAARRGRPGSRSSAPRRGLVGAIALACAATAASSTGWGAGRRGTAWLFDRARRAARLPDVVARRARLAQALTPGLSRRSDRGAEGRVVFSDLRRATDRAFAPVYVAATPPGHVADTKANHPYDAGTTRRVLPHRRPGDTAPLRRHLDRRRPLALGPDAATCPSSSATGASRSTGCSPPADVRSRAARRGRARAPPAAARRARERAVLARVREEAELDEHRRDVGPVEAGQVAPLDDAVVARARARGRRSCCSVAAPSSTGRCRPSTAGGAPGRASSAARDARVEPSAWTRTKSSGVLAFAIRRGRRSPIARAGRPGAGQHHAAAPLGQCRLSRRLTF